MDASVQRSVPIEPSCQHSSSSSSLNPMSMEKVNQVRQPTKPSASIQPQSAPITNHSVSQRKWEPVIANQNPTTHVTSLQLPSAPTRHIASEHQRAFNSRPTMSTVLTQEPSTGILSGHVANSAAPVGGSYPSRMAPSEHHQPSYLSRFSYTASPHPYYYSASRPSYPHGGSIGSIFPYGTSIEPI